MFPELFGEAFGTFLLLQLALGIVPSAIIAQSMTGVFPLAVLTGGAIAVAVAAVNSKCDAHFNPAITFAMCVHRRFGWTKFVPYVTCQLVGAVLATCVNYGLYARHIQQFELQNGIVRATLDGIRTAKFTACYFDTTLVSPLAAFFAEAFGTFMLTATVFAISSEKNTKAKKLFQPALVGSVVALIISYLGPLTCASLNPARELGPRLVLKLLGWSQAAFHQIGIYLLAPFVGAVLGGWFVEKWLYGDDEAFSSSHQLTFRERTTMEKFSSSEELNVRR
jgi:glycerol uptake facilitator protein